MRPENLTRTSAFHWGHWVFFVNFVEGFLSDPVDSPSKNHARNAASSSSNSNMKALRMWQGMWQGESWNVMDIEFQTSQTSIIKPSNGTKDRRHRPLSIPESSAIDKPDVSDVNRERPMTPRGCDGLFTRIVVGLLAKLAAPILYVPDPLFGIANDWFCGSEAQSLELGQLI